MNVLLFTGFSGFTQRLDNVMALAQSEFGCRVDCLVFGPNNYDYLKRRAKTDDDRKDNLWDWERERNA